MPSSPNTPPQKPNNYGWTPERRAAARERAFAHKPWEHSTGPKTKAGKARVAQNARKYPIYQAEIRALTQEMLFLNAAFVKRCRAITNMQFYHNIIKHVRPRTPKNKLIKQVLSQGDRPPPPIKTKSKLINPQTKL